MWTRLLAAAAAHDLNNVSQGLSALLEVASAPGVPADALSRYLSVAQDTLSELRRLSDDLHALGRSHDDAGPQRVDVACADAVTETDVPGGRSLSVEPPGSAAAPLPLVRATAAGLRTAVKAMLRHALAASAPGATVRLSAGATPDGRHVAVVVVLAGGGGAAGRAAAASAAAVPGGGEQELRGHLALVLASAIAREHDGDLRVSAPEPGGLCLELRLPRAG